MTQTMTAKLTRIQEDLLAWAGLHRGIAISEATMPRFHEIIDSLSNEISRETAMNEQLTLISQILSILCTTDLYLPHNSYGTNVGQCRYCGAVGQLDYPAIRFEHREECVISLCKRLIELQKNDS